MKFVQKIALDARSEDERFFRRICAIGEDLFPNGQDALRRVECPQEIRSRSVEFVKIWISGFEMDISNSQGRISSGSFLRFVFPKMLGCSFKGWKVFRLDGCTSMKFMLSMDRYFSQG